MKNTNFTNLVKYNELTDAGNLTEAKKVRDQIISDNLNLIRALAHKYARMSSHLESEDLVNEGVMGMMEAIKRYDINRGIEFSTYATFWVYRDITRALSNTGRTIRVPERIAGVLPKLRRATIEYVERFGFAPDIITLAESLGMSPGTAKAAYAIMAEPASLVNDEGESIDLESDAMPVDEHVELSLRNQSLRRVIGSSLSEREAQIICGRFGLGDDGREHSLEDLGVELSISRERVRQIEQSAIKKLKGALCAREL